MCAGDEYGSSRGGNNNWYGHDNAMTWYKWDQLEKNADSQEIFNFFSQLIHFRQASPLLGRAEFLTDADVTWHENDWGNPEGRFLAFTLHDRGQGCGSLLIAFNAHTFAVDF